MLLAGVQGWFDAPVVARVVARFMSNTNRIGADDVLARIGALRDWRWCSPTRKPRVGARRDRSSGVRPRF
ncbi:MAG: hypothetical protein GDA36_00830 [Rhodobacteraceae bacterium]|nr:hypothetical protein [Paracoccaceae bacterium]